MNTPDPTPTYNPHAGRLKWTNDEIAMIEAEMDRTFVPGTEPMVFLYTVQGVLPANRRSTASFLGIAPTPFVRKLEALYKAADQPIPRAHPRLAKHMIARVKAERAAAGGIGSPPRDTERPPASPLPIPLSHHKPLPAQEPHKTTLPEPPAPAPKAEPPPVQGDYTSIPTAQPQSGQDNDKILLSDLERIAAHPDLAAASLPSSILVGELFARLATEFLGRLDRIEKALLAPRQPIILNLERGGYSTALATTTTAPPPVPTPRPRQEPPPPPIRVAIVGPFSDQFAHLKEKTKELPFELVFADKEDRHVRLPQAEYAIISRHTRHTWWEKARNTYPPGHLFFSEGGISSIVQTLYDLHSKIVQKAVNQQGD